MLRGSSSVVKGSAQAEAPRESFCPRSALAAATALVVATLGALVAPARHAHAEEPGAPAAQVVDSVSAARLAKAEIHTKPKEEREPAALTADAETRDLVKKDAQAPLKNRLELTAGTDGLVVISSASKQISLFGEARYRLTRQIQLGGTLAVRSQSGDHSSDFALQALVGPTFNFGTTSNDSLGSAFFVSPQLGLTTATTSFNHVTVASNTQATAALHAGKRFELGSHVSYAPSVGVVKQWSFSPSYVVQPIALSVFF